MNDRKRHIFETISLILSLLSWPLTCYTWPGLVTSGLVIVLFVVFTKREGKATRPMTAALIIAGAYLLVWLLFFIAAGVYRSILSLGKE